MKAFFYSVRAAVTLLLVLTFCVLIVWGCLTDKIDAKIALGMLNGAVMMAMTFYFTKKRDGG